MNTTLNLETQTAMTILPEIQVRPQPCYFQDSEFYQLHGGFTAEVIQNPFNKFLEKGITNNVIHDLTKVTLASFEKSQDESEIYAPEKVIIKNAVLVDWLTIVRHENKIVAYASSSYLDEFKNTLYFNATIVDADFKQYSIGSITHMYIFEKILKSRNDFESSTLNLITRTRNRSVAKLLESVMLDVKYSSDSELDCEDKSFFSQAAKMIGGTYNEKDGISMRVYPTGLPVGSDKVSEKIQRVFAPLGETDGLLILGKCNYLKICKFLKREIKKSENTESESETINQIKAA
jgi:hypothetical protein